MSFEDRLHRAMFPFKEGEIALLRAKCVDLQTRLDAANYYSVQLTLQLDTLKNKIVAKAEQQPTIKAKSAAEIRRIVEAQNEREFEESANGV